MANITEADLVLEGGGVKGIALVGALSVLLERGLVPKRVAGSSAGAIVGAFVAAGFDAPTMQSILDAVEYESFEDRTVWSHLGPLGRGLSILIEQGEYRGEVARTWIEQELAERGKRTFADLAPIDPAGADAAMKDLPSRLVVMTSDISAGKLRRLPWDAAEYGEQPGQMSIAGAVRASMSIPFFFKPVIKRTKSGQRAWLVDGGMLSDFPIDTFDRRDGAEPRWPTIGLKLSAKPTAGQDIANPVHGVLSMAKAMLNTMTGWYDNMHLDDPATVARTIFIDTTGVSATDFGLSADKRKQLYESGRAAAEKFLDGGDGQDPWDWAKYKRDHPHPPLNG